MSDVREHKSVLQVAYENVEACSSVVQDLMYKMHVSDDETDVGVGVNADAGLQLELEKHRLDLSKYRLMLAENFTKRMMEIKELSVDMDRAWKYADGFMFDGKTGVSKGLKYFKEILKPWQFTYVASDEFCDYCAKRTSGKVLVVSCADPVSGGLVTICNNCHLERSGIISGDGG